jgi:hypothetical protein
MGNLAFDLSFETSPPSDFDGPRREAFFACNGEHMHKIAPTVLLFLASSTLGFGQSAEQDWTNHVRIGAYGIGNDNANAIVEDASRSHVFGIEVDNDIPGRYESYLDPTEKLANIRAVAKKAHEKGNYAFVYIAGTECITANASSTKHTLAKDHPDWLQEKNHRRVCGLRQRCSFLDHQGRRRCVGESLRNRVAQALHATRSRDCRNRH